MFYATLHCFLLTIIQSEAYRNDCGEIEPPKVSLITIEYNAAFGKKQEMCDLP